MFHLDNKMAPYEASGVGRFGLSQTLGTHNRSQLGPIRPTPHTGENAYVTFLILCIR